MAKKKKKAGGARDARGYAGQSTSSTTSTMAGKATAAAAPVVSSQTHTGMKTLLTQLKSSQLDDAAVPSSSSSSAAPSSTATVAVASTRFGSNLSSWMDQWLEWGFTDAHIESAVQALGYSLTMETALDWFCLHLPTKELPVLFSDGRVRTDERDAAAAAANGGRSGISILRLVPPTPSSSSLLAGSSSSTTTTTTIDDRKSSLARTTALEESELQKASVAKVKRRNEQEKKREQAEEKEAAERKAWLLQQYQYDDYDADDNDDDDDDDDEADNGTNGDSGAPTMVADAREGTPAQLAAAATTTSTSTDTTTDTTTLKPVLLSPDEQALVEEEQALNELEADVNNDANNYMRTKHEIKELRKELRQKRQLVQGIRRRIERQKAKDRKQEQEQTTVVAEGDDKEDEAEVGGGFVDMFGGGDDRDDGDEEKVAVSKITSAAPAPAPTPYRSLLDAVVPNDWTGTTPQKILEEYCRKQKRPRPKYTKLPYNQGYQLALAPPKGKGKMIATLNKSTWMANAGDFIRGSSLQDYLAVQALYEMDASLPLYRVFPPDFRDLWLSWQRQVDEVQSQHVQAQDAAKQRRLDYMIALLQDNQNQINATNTNVHTTVVSLTPTSAGHRSTEKKDLEVQEHWDDSDNDQVCDINMAPGQNRPNKRTPVNGPSTQGKRLQQEFKQRQGTPAYQKMLQVRSHLPMTAYRDEILDTIQCHPVTILSAQTGAGKTTQCPQYLLEKALMEGRGDAIQILVTQPRRVAATSVAERVADELCEPRLGKWIGYQIRMEAKRSAETKLLFCTTGIVLRRLQEDRNLDGVTHVIVDEVHERQQQTDVLLIALRQLLQTSRPDLKVILMSATLDSELFCSFFGGAPLLSVPGRTFPVSNYHLEDLMDATDHMIEEGSRYALRDSSNGQRGKTTLWVTNKGGEKRREVVDLTSQTDVSDVSDLYSGYKMATRRSMDRVNEEVVNYDLLEDTLSLILCRPDHNTSLLPPEGAEISKGSVLVFLPGLGEIRAMTERLEGNRQFRDVSRFEIIPMHSTLSSKDQRRAFLPAKIGSRKIILSTNIAETSVTIPDVVCVIDTGRVREVRRNKRTSTSILVTDWCSKASAKQRAGRAGRVQPGICLKLYSSRTAQVVMRSASEPELRRVPLEEVCLNILASGLSTNSMFFLSQAPQPPTEESVKAAVDVLQEVGAIEIVEGKSFTSRRNERLTPLGRHLAKLPVDVRLGKMLIFGAMFRCLDKTLTIAAALSSQSPFATFVTDGNVAKAKQRAFSDPDSDFLTLCNVWESFWSASKSSTNAGRKFCNSNFLNSVAMREIGDARRQFLDLLCSIGFVDRKKIRCNGANKRGDADLSDSVYNVHGSNTDLVHAVICAGLYPNVAHLEQPTSGDYTMFHKQERLHFHRASVNSLKKRFSDSWVVFHEKFGTPHRVSVSTTCFVQPFALLLLGGSVTVRHTKRLVLVDDWIEISMAAQIGVMMKELRKQVDVLLVKMIERTNSTETEEMGVLLVQGLVNLLLA